MKRMECYLNLCHVTSKLLMQVSTVVKCAYPPTFYLVHLFSFKGDLTMKLSLVTQNTSVAIPFQDDDINELDEVFYVSLMVVGDYDHALVQIHHDSTLPKECKIRDDDGKIAGLNWLPVTYYVYTMISYYVI